MEAVVQNPDPRAAAPAAAEVDSLRAGQKLGRYTLLAPVAQGGMARVWAARQTGTRGFQKMVAIKTIMPALAADQEFERMFLDEARIAAAIHHPNVCEILDLGEEGSVLFLAMEWVEGTSLLAMIKSRAQPLPDLIAARIVADACAGLHAAHELRNEHGASIHVVHRDVSPHNILIANDGTVKVADFGVAKAMGVEHAPTMAGQLKGKVAYMSPEQAVGDISIDRRSDIFSLGAVLYEAVTGKRAWPGNNDVIRLQNLLAGNIMHPRQFRPDLPVELENILACSLAIDPNARFQTAEQMRLALEQFLISRNAIVSPSDVAQLVWQLCGAEVEERRTRIRLASAAVSEDPALPTPAQLSRSLSGLEQDMSVSGMRKVTAASITIVFGALTVAGLLGILAVSRFPPRTDQTPGATTPSQTPPQPSAMDQKKPEPVAVDPKPSDAQIEINGNLVGKGKQTVPRPEPGTTTKVVVSAPGFLSTTLIIDAESPAVRSVELVPSPTVPASASASSKASTAKDAQVSAPKGPSTTPKPIVTVKPGPAVVVPKNPY